MKHNHEGDRLTFGCEACIAAVKEDQRQVERWEDPREVEFEVDVDFDVQAICRDKWTFKAPEDITLKEFKDRFADEVLSDVDVGEFVTAYIAGIRVKKKATA